MGTQDVVAFLNQVARRHGHEFDVSELTQVVEAINAGGSRELSDEELEAVAGGYKEQISGSNLVKLGSQLSNIKYGSNLLDPTSFGVRALTENDYRLELVISDERGERTVLDRRVPAGQAVSTSVTVYGNDALLQTFINGDPFQAWRP